MTSIKPTNDIQTYLNDSATSIVILMGVLVYFPTLMIILLMAYTRVIDFKIALVLAFLFLFFYGIILFSMYQVFQNFLLFR
jgi:hypothetical protein